MRTANLRFVLLLVLLVCTPAVFAACNDVPVPVAPHDLSINAAKGGTRSPTPRRLGADKDTEALLISLVTDANARLAAKNYPYRIDRAFYYTAGEEQGRTIFFDDRTLRLGLHYVPGDPRRANGDNLDIAYMIDQVELPTGFDASTTTAAGDRAMSTWDGVECSDIPITKLPNIPDDIGFLNGGIFAALLGADITHAGWLPTLGGTTLGVTIPFAFIDGEGNFTDINNDGMIDTAFSEIYYSNAFEWADDGVSNIDIESVMLHEAGHGLDQGHFGKLFRTDKNGKFHFAPRALMNAGYTGPQRDVNQVDSAGHCTLWASWPNR